MSVLEKFKLVELITTRTDAVATFVSGNQIKFNSATHDWITSGTVSTDNSTDVQSHTASDSCFVLGDNSTLSQVITGVVPGSYVISLRAKKTGASYTSYFRVQYNGNKYA